MYSHILVPVAPDHGGVGARIVAVARRLAGEHGRITLMTVVEPVPSHIATHIPTAIIEGNRASARHALAALARAHGIDPAAVVIRDGSPGAVILDEAGRLGADAIVLGSHRPGIADYLIGSTAARVVRHAHCTVVVERSGPGAA